MYLHKYNPGYLAGINFIHTSHLVTAAQVFQAERARAALYDHCYPRFATLAYTIIVEALRDNEARTTDEYDALLSMWSSMQYDPDQNHNFDLMKDVRIIFTFNVHVHVCR